MLSRRLAFPKCRIAVQALLTVGVLASGTTALAQDTSEPPPAPVTPAPAPTPVTPVTPAPPAPADSNALPVLTPAPAGAIEVKKDAKWYDVINAGAFVDTYYSQNWRRPRPNAGANLYQPYTPNSGFGLAWLGLDASIDPDPVGAVLQLRFGPSVPNLALGDFSIPGGIGFVQNGYVSWKPGGKDGSVLLILGKFDSLYGAEVAQSQLNINYTRGYLYNLAQPFFHTGARADIALNKMLTLKLLAVNGWNNTIDNNRGKSFGAQIVAAPTAGVTLAAGYLGGPEENDVSTVSCAAGTTFDVASGSCVPAVAGAATGGTLRNPGADSRWRHLVDIVGDVTVAKLRLVLNGDYVTQTVAVENQDTSVSWFGASLLARYTLSDVWGMGLRGEIIRDTNGQISAPNTSPMTLYTGTVTVDAAVTKMLLVRLDNRVDAANLAVFGAGLHGAEKTQLTSTLGVVVHTN